MVTFLLNNRLVETGKNPGMSLLDYIRYEADLPSTKVGCREGDCGACTVMLGELKGEHVEYKSIVSCLTPLVNAHGRHIVTVEGINLDKGLTPVQKVMVDNAATQCGFCTPGFVMSFTSYCLSHERPSTEGAINAVSGNICRCTGYKSIERAAADLNQIIRDKNLANPMGWMVEKGYLPAYFLDVPGLLGGIHPLDYTAPENPTYVGGATDLMVQKPNHILNTPIIPAGAISGLKGIGLDGSRCVIGAATTFNEFAHSDLLGSIIPTPRNIMSLVASDQVRNSATIAGNIVNASPIADLSIILLSLNAEISTSLNGNRRVQPLREFYTGYKRLNLYEGERVESISFEIPSPKSIFNFEKVSKRKYLDIASVNSSILACTEGNVITSCHVSAGGVAPIPMYLSNTSMFMVGKPIIRETFEKANAIMQAEISPISDIRGSADYKRLLLRQLLFAHLSKLSPELLEVRWL